MPRAYLGLGGNLGDPRRAMSDALRAIDADASTAVDAVSPLYRTPPWGRADQPDFLNAVARVETGLAPRALLALCLDTEKSLKRVRAERWGPRLIDIDILIYGDVLVDEEGLRIPHPRMLERAFVLRPLSDVAPTLDLLGKSALQRAREAEDGGIARLTENGDWWRESR